MKKIFYITTQDICEKYGNGGAKISQRNYQLIEEYFGKSNIVLCTFSRKNINKNHDGEVVFQRAESPLQKMISALCGCKIYLPWKERAILKCIKSQKIDVLFIDGSTLGRLAKFNGDYKTIVFYHNIEADYAWNKVRNEGIQYIPSYMASRYNDKMATKADMIIGLNGRDSERLYQLYGRKMDYLLPATFTDVFDEKRVNNQYKREIIFVGSFFSANQVSIEWFMREVMPKLDNIVLNIVGKGFEVMKSAYEKIQNVHVIGSVHDLDEYYYRHAAVVIPIISGAGMKVKTAEAMMFGRVIFASDEALEGYDVDEVDDVHRCNSAEEYIMSINNYFEQKNMQEYSKGVRKLFLEKYESNKVKMDFFEKLHTILD